MPFGFRTIIKKLIILYDLIRFFFSKKLFGFDNLQGYGKQRIYAFLAERFMSYWFRKNTKSTLMPIIFYDIRKDIK